MAQNTTQTHLSQLETRVNDLLSKIQTLEHYNAQDLAKDVQAFNIEMQKNILAQVIFFVMLFENLRYCFAELVICVWP